jgi:transposase
MNKTPNKFSREVREPVVRMVQEYRGEYPSLWAAIESIAPKIGCVPQTLHEWVKRVEVNKGVREGVTTSEAQRVKELEREVKEVRRANEILKLAFFHRRAPWKTKEAVEFATLKWVFWFNHHRLLQPIGYILPAQAEANYYRQLASQTSTVAT